MHNRRWNGGKKGVQEVLYSLHPFFYFHLCGSHGETQGSISLATRLSTVPTMLCVCSIRGSGGQFPFPPFHHSESPFDYTTTKLLRDVISIQLTNHPVRRGSSRHSNEMPPHDKIVCHSSTLYVDDAVEVNGVFLGDNDTLHQRK